jgi:hypothetical protein
VRATCGFLGRDAESAALPEEVRANDRRLASANLINLARYSAAMVAGPTVGRATRSSSLQVRCVSSDRSTSNTQAFGFPLTIDFMGHPFADWCSCAWTPLKRCKLCSTSFVADAQQCISWGCEEDCWPAIRMGSRLKLAQGASARLIERFCRWQKPKRQKLSLSKSCVSGSPAP